jgi:hypothetical protein
LREKKRKGKWMWMTDIGAKINVFLYFIRKKRLSLTLQEFQGFRMRVSEAPYIEGYMVK